MNIAVYCLWPLCKRAFIKPFRKQFSLNPVQLFQKSNHDYSHKITGTEVLYCPSSIRNSLYSTANDEVINRLKASFTVEKVIAIIENNEISNPQQMSQAILTLRDIQKAGYVQALFESNPIRRYDNFVEYLNKQPSFHKLLDLIENNVQKMGIEETSVCLLYLCKFNVNRKKSVISKLVNACEETIASSTDCKQKLNALARLFVVIKDYNNIWALNTMNQYSTFLNHCLDTCQNYDNFRHITTCFQKCVPLLSDYHLNKYTQKMNMMMLRKFNDDSEDLRIRTILKTATFLNFKTWNGFYKKEIRLLVNEMRNHLHRLSLEEVTMLHKIIFPLQEPFCLLREIEEIMRKRMSISEFFEPSFTTFSVISFPGMKFQMGSDLKTKMKKYLTSTSYLSEHQYPINFLLFSTEFKNDKEITNAFWTALVDGVRTQEGDTIVDYVLWMIHKYMYFVGSQNTNRCEYFEKQIIPHIFDLMYNQQKINYNPSHYTTISLAILVFHKNPFNFFTRFVWHKLIDCLPRLSVKDNLFACLMLRIAAVRFKKRRYDVAIFLNYYVHSISAANVNILNDLRQSPNITMEKINSLLFAYVLIEGMKSSTIFKKICDRLKHVTCEELHSKVIRDAILNFNMCNHLLTDFTNLMVEYCIRERNIINGNTIAALLNYCFIFGFTPKCLQSFSEVAVNLIGRDREQLSNFVFLRSAVALSYFGELPLTWSDYIFNVEYLEKIDKNIDKLSYRNASLLRKELMELNRIVCIDYPSCDIPWFHEKYCKEQIALERSKHSTFYLDVLNVLKTLISIEGAINTNCSSPYGHKIDILLYLDKNNQPTHPEKCRPSELKKIAIILKTSSSPAYFNGKGKLELFVRQLEMLNYGVMMFNKQEWNSMHMSENEVKVSHLRKSIYSV